MKSELPLRLEDLLHERAIEGNRIEFKATWNDVIAEAVMRTACAFANDLLNLNGGYIILGVEEHEGRAILPPRGLGNMDLDLLQKKIHGVCSRIEPAYRPLIAQEHFEGRPLLVLWCIGGDNRPYAAPEGREKVYYVRQGPLTIKAQGDIMRQLLELTAKVPFDDRRSLTGRIEDISPTLVRRFLHQVGSRLVDEPVDDRDVYRRLNIVVPVNSHEAPRNVGLLFFNEDPDRFFPGARIEVVRFGDDAGGDLIEERVFRGPIHEQLQAVLSHIKSISSELVQKVPGAIESRRITSYPEDAVREALANAIYHRGYDEPQEPIKVYLYSDRMEITSYPGPMPGIRPEHFQRGSEFPTVRARNRRVGDFLKELHLAEKRGTGIARIYRAMAQVSAPPPRFAFDEGNTYFCTRLYMSALSALYVGQKLWEAGKRRQAVDHTWRVYQRQPDSDAQLGDKSLPELLIEWAWEVKADDIAAQAFALYEGRKPARTR